MSNFDSVEQQASYGIGRQMGEQFANEPFGGFDKDAALAGFTDALQGVAPQVEPAAINAAFQEIQGRLQAEQAEKAKTLSAEGEKFLEENAKKDGVTVLASGLQYEIITEGSGEKPVATSTVRTHYHGTLIDGTVFDSSYDRGQPAEFPVNGVIAGWTEALQLMPVGSKWRLTIPYNLAYGEQGAGGAIGPYSTLVFDVELLDIL
ncbi:MAG: FKBP-type peptidyl-prolyl cis-trans isomerase [Candidatus Pelagadaptatus aseana]|uniref:FKBP-type peptidyl-prolyl cis-trans isomerase n=1 Tax=Candidatus Pelagadaptatus aseana TaxID=3120508 RepID=UPI0039B21E06